MRNIIAVKHNIEVAHRLFESLPGNKCENIHGHSMLVTLELQGEVRNGLLEGVDFGSLKKAFRGHLDDTYDHHLLLNHADTFAEAVETREGWKALPGLRTCEEDPTTENIARWIYQVMKNKYNYPVSAVTVWETAVNMARIEG